MKSIANHSWLLLGLLSLALGLTAEHWVSHGYLQWSARQKHEEIQQNVLHAERQIDGISQRTDFQVLANGEPKDAYKVLKELAAQSYSEFFLFQGADLLAYTANSISPPKYFEEVQRLSYLRLKNGRYLLKTINLSQNRKLVAMVQLERQFSVRSRFLRRRLTIANDDKGILRTESARSEGGKDILDKTGRALFKTVQARHKVFQDWPSTFYLLALLLIFVYLKNGSKSLTNRVKWGVIGSVLICILLALVFRQPRVVFESSWFNTQDVLLYGRLFSLGDVLLGTLLIYLGSTFLFNKVLLSRIATGRFRWLCIAVPLAMAVLASYLIQILILQSKINLKMEGVNDLSAEGGAAIVVIYFGMLLATQMVVRLLSLKGRMPSAALQVVSLVVLIATGVQHIVFADEGFVPFYVVAATGFIGLLVFLLSLSVFSKPLHNQPGIRISTLLLITALHFSFSYAIHNSKKRDKYRELLAIKLLNEEKERDEQLFSGLSAYIAQDPLFNSTQKGPLFAKSVLTQRIRKLYLLPYQSRYAFDVCLFSGSRSKGLLTYKKLVREKGMAREPGLFKIEGEKGFSRYILFSKPVSDTSRSTLVIDLTEKVYVEKSVSIPLLSGDADANSFSEDLNYGVYYNGLLVSAKGNPKMHLAQGSHSFAEDSYNINTQESGPFQVVVAESKQGLITMFSLFSLSFFLCTTLFLIISFFGWRLFRLAEEPGFGVARKIQAALIVSVLLSLVFSAAVTRQFLKEEYTGQQRERMSAASSAISSWISEEGQSMDTIGSQRLEEIIQEASALLQYDVSLYNTMGAMVFTTQPDLVNAGLFSKMINDEALYQLRDKGVRNIILSEQIGSLEYLSAYTVMQNKGEVLGYLAVPAYEANQQLTKEMDGFFSTLLNLYLILFLLLGVISVLLAKSISYPLEMLAERLRELSLGGQNQELKWDRRDEIGVLVSEYNQMLHKLQESANSLAEKERNEAWNRMARQVAHEIKNPLTPMKLQIQQLQRAWKDDHPNLEKIMDRVTNVIVGQIENLSRIASDFALYARMATDSHEKVDVKEVAKEVADLYSGSKGAEVGLGHMPDGQHVKVNRDQFRRSIVNLIKNATEAAKPNSIVQVTISAKTESEKVILEVKDNGTGIPKEVQERLFEPSFSTKTSGMGLGLAIVKEIITKAEGDISFSTSSEGTRFIITLPLYNEASH